MANLTGTYDPNAEASQDFGAIPAGEYLAVITDSDMKPTKNNDGHYLELAYEITAGDLKGRKLWTRLNLDNQNVQTVEIANKQFRSIRDATGVANPKDSVQLHNKPHLIRVDFLPAGSTDRRGQVRTKDQNEIKGWRAPEGATETTAAPAATTTSAPAGKAPWGSTKAA